MLIHCWKKDRRQDVWSPAGLVLIFFIAPHFGFVTKTESIRHQWFGYCWEVLIQHQDFIFPTLPQQGGWGEHEKLGVDTAGAADHWAKGYSMFFMFLMLCSGIKAQEKEEDAGTIVVMVVVFPSRHYVCWSRTFREVAQHPPANGKQ